MERWLTEKQATNLTGFSASWFQKKRVTGGGPPFTKIDRAIRYPAAELLDWFNSWGTVASTSERPRGPRQTKPSDKATAVLRRRTRGGKVRVHLIEGLANPPRQP